MSRHPQGHKHDTNRLRVRCPHCSAFARARNSRSLTPIYIETRFECVNEACGHVWLSAIEILRTLIPSAAPNPAIRLECRVGMPVAAASTQGVPTG